MINRAALAAAVLTASAGAVIFLSTLHPQNGDTVPPEPVVPVSLPVVVAVIPSTASAVPAAAQVAPPSSKPADRVAPRAAKPQVAPSRKSATPPRRFAAQAPTTQPQPAGMDPNGSGGWQLPACYEESCVAPGSGH